MSSIYVLHAPSAFDRGPWRDLRRELTTRAWSRRIGWNYL